MKRIMLLFAIIVILTAGPLLLSGCMDFRFVPESQIRALRDEINNFQQLSWELEIKVQRVKKLRDENDKLEKQIIETKIRIEELRKNLEKQRLL